MLRQVPYLGLVVKDAISKLIQLLLALLEVLLGIAAFPLDIQIWNPQVLLHYVGLPEGATGCL